MTQCNPAQFDITDTTFTIKSRKKLVNIVDFINHTDIDGEVTRGVFTPKFGTPSIDNLLFAQVKDEISLIVNPDVKAYATRISEILLAEVLSYKDFTNFQPVFGVSDETDGSFLIEWIYDEYRIGFGIEREIDHSSWYLTSKREMGGINASGSLIGINPVPLISWLVYFVQSQVNF